MWPLTCKHRIFRTHIKCYFIPVSEILLDLLAAKSESCSQAAILAKKTRLNFMTGISTDPQILHWLHGKNDSVHFYLKISFDLNKCSERQTKRTYFRVGGSLLDGNTQFAAISTSNMLAIVFRPSSSDTGFNAQIDTFSKVVNLLFRENFQRRKG